MVLARALEVAANKNVNRAPGSSRFSLDTNSLLKVSKKKNVRLGFKVRISCAEYPDQNPWYPFSSFIFCAISRTVGSGPVEPLREASIFDVCFRVTILEIGAVHALEHAPASIPTRSSSSTGSVVALRPCFWSRFVRKEL